MDHMVELFTNLSREDADIYSLVLTSADIANSMENHKELWMLMVPEADGLRAAACIQNYLDENVALPEHGAETSGKRGSFAYPGLVSGLAGSLFLQVSHYITRRMAGDDVAFIHNHSASSYHILHGEVHRAVTALMLHADLIHLAGNVAGMVIFASAVSAMMGSGVGWLMILLTGITGNILNAVLHQSVHFSIGSSTAVFGAVGILSAGQLVQRARTPLKRKSAWMPLAGGIALLIMLGSEGENTDIPAHVFGFVSGIVFGGIYAFFFKERLKRKYQLICLAATACTIAASWLKLF